MTYYMVSCYIMSYRVIVMLHIYVYDVHYSNLSCCIMSLSMLCYVYDLLYDIMLLQPME
jgi:hypothetical protein